MQKVTPSILSHFRLESPYSLYSELPDSEANSAPDHNSLNINYHTIKTRDTSVNNSDTSSNQLGYVYSAKNVELIGSNNTVAHNCTEFNDGTYSNSHNDTESDRENIEISTSYDTKPIKLVQNDTSFEVSSERVNDTVVVNYNTLIKFAQNETLAGNVSNLAQNEPNSTVKLLPATPFQRQEAETENSIEVIKSVSTEYEPLIDNNIYGPAISNRKAASYGPSRNVNPNRGSYQPPRSQSRNNVKNRNIVYHKEDATHTVSRLIDMTAPNGNGKKASQNGYNYLERPVSWSTQSDLSTGYTYPEKQTATPTVSKVIDIETKNTDGYRANGYDSSAKIIEIGSPFRPPASHNENHRTIASSLTVGQIRGDNFRTAASFTVERIRSDEFKVTSAPVLEKSRGSESRSTRAPSRSRGSSAGRSEVPTRNGRPYRGGKKYRSTEKPPEKKIEVEDRREDRSDGSDESSNWISLPSGQRLAAEDVMSLNSLDTGSFLSYDIPPAEK